MKERRPKNPGTQWQVIVTLGLIGVASVTAIFLCESGDWVQRSHFVPAQKVHKARLDMFGADLSPCIYCTLTHLHAEGTAAGRE